MSSNNSSIEWETSIELSQSYHQFRTIHRILRKCFIPYIFAVASLGIVTNTITVVLLSKNVFTKTLRNKWTLTALGTSIFHCYRSSYNATRGTHFWFSVLCLEKVRQRIIDRSYDRWLIDERMHPWLIRLFRCSKYPNHWALSLHCWLGSEKIRFVRVPSRLILRGWNEMNRIRMWNIASREMEKWHWCWRWTSVSVQSIRWHLWLDACEWGVVQAYQKKNTP